MTSTTVPYLSIPKTAGRGRNSVLLPRAGGPGDAALVEAAGALRRALDCRANTLVTGDVAAARAFFRAHLPSSLREVDWRELNREGPGILFVPPPDPAGAIFLDRIERLHSWVRAALLDMLESRSPGERDGLPRLISGCYHRSESEISTDGLEGALYYRLGTITVHVPFRRRALLKSFWGEAGGSFLEPVEYRV